MSEQPAPTASEHPPAKPADLAPPGKLDPETLAIRARPQRATRFKREMIIAGAGVGAMSLAGIAFMALRPHVHLASRPTELSQPSTAASPDALNAVPAGYGDVPRLGPPLPGDLGKPILEQQQSALARAANADRERQAQTAAADRERRSTELRTARQSGLLVQAGPGSAGPASQPVLGAGPLAMQPVTDAPRIAMDPVSDPNAQGRKADFVRALDKDGDLNPHKLASAASPTMLSAGSVIAASLITGLRSNLPGLVTAQVTENVYDSATGRILLIPQGARLIGSYDSVVAFGQRRALVVWQRILFPDGSSLALDNVPAADAAGYAGLEDKVDVHSWVLLKGVVVSTLLGVGAELQFHGGSDLVEAVRQSTQQSVSRAGDQLTSKALDIQPTITIRPGAPVRLVVHHDLLLSRWKGGIRE